MNDVYESPEHLVLHHSSVPETLNNSLVGVIALKDTQKSHLSLEIVSGLDSPFMVCIR